MQTSQAAHVATPSFDTQECLRRAGARQTTTARYPRNAAIFLQGDPAGNVLYIQSGTVRVSVHSTTGREAVVAMLGPGDFLGEGCLVGQRTRTNSATAMDPTTLLSVEKDAMAHLLRESADLADRFMTHVLNMNIRIEADLTDRFFSPIEKRLARRLLLLAQETADDEERPVRGFSQEALAGMIGATRTRVSYFMNKFRRLGFVEYDANGRGIKIQKSLGTLVRQD